MSSPFMSELRIMAFDYPPKNWAQCNGQLLPINQNQALFSLLGTTYGGNGQTNFALPDLRGKAPIHIGGGLSQGTTAGENAHTLSLPETPTHIHMLAGDANNPAASNNNTPAAGNSVGRTLGIPSQGATFPVNIYSSNMTNLNTLHPATVSSTGGTQPHENRQPFLALNFCICLQGIFPSHN